MNTHEHRPSLGFAEQVKSRFSYLISQGFTLSSASDTEVHYERDDLGVSRWHETNMGYEIDAAVSVGGRRYSMASILGASDPELFRNYRLWAAVSPETVAEGVDQLAMLFHRYAGPVLSRDQAFLDKLEALRSRRHEALAREREGVQFRPKAHAAFHAQDYHRAIESFERIEAQLSPAERAMLAYAKRHCQNAVDGRASEPD